MTEETIKTAISYTGVAAATASSASSTRPQTPRQRVPTEKMERLGIEASPDVLKSRQGEEDWVKRKETETERAAEVSVDTQVDHSITKSAQPTGAFTLPLETIMMPISCTRVAAAATTVASSSWAEPVGSAAVTGSDTNESQGVGQSSITIAQMESALVMENPMANYHEEHTVEEAARELDPWFRQIGFAEDDVKILVLRFSKPDFGVTNCALMFSLEDEDVDVILEGCPLGHKRAIKRALKKGKNA